MCGAISTLKIKRYMVDCYYYFTIANSEDLPNPIYMYYKFYPEWNEDDSVESPGWCKCTISSNDSDGNATLLYSDQQVRGG